MAQDNPTPGDDLFMPLVFVAVLLLLDVLFSNTAALPGHNHMEPLDSALKALVMLTLAIVAYARPVEFGAQLLERGRILAGLGWLLIILGTPFVVLALVDEPAPQLGLLASVICALVANIATRFLDPAGRR